MSRSSTISFSGSSIYYHYSSHYYVQQYSRVLSGRLLLKEATGKCSFSSGTSFDLTEKCRSFLQPFDLLFDRFDSYQTISNKACNNFVTKSFSLLSIAPLADSPSISTFKFFPVLILLHQLHIRFICSYNGHTTTCQHYNSYPLQNFELK